MPILDLPLPVSTNRFWRAGRGKVFRSKEYDSWIKAASWELLAQRPGQVEAQVDVSNALGRPQDNRKRNLDTSSRRPSLIWSQAIRPSRMIRW